MCLVGSIESSLEIDFFGYDGCRSSLSSVYFSESFLSLFLLVGGNVENWVRSKAQKPIERIEGRPSGV